LGDDSDLETLPAGLIEEPLMLPRPHPLLIVLSGPSGVGKDAVLQRMKERNIPLFYAVTATTRPRREGEIDGLHYYFLSIEEFERMREQGEFLEHACVYGNYYGVPRKPVADALALGQDVLLKVDVQGAETIQRSFPQALFIFLAPPSMAELAERLRTRKTEPPMMLLKRLMTAREEMRKLEIFDYVVVNYQDRVDEAVDKILAIVTAEKCKVKPRKVSL
jgi:guanylate kinase